MNNVRNKLITKEFVETLVNKYMPNGRRITVNDLSVFQKAFIHKDLCSDRNNFNDPADEDCVMSVTSGPLSFKRGGSNETLEFLGDSVVSLVVAEFLFDKFQNKDEGFLTRIRSKMVRKEKMAHYADQLHFREYLLLSSHLERIGSRDNPRLMEDIFESFIGSLYKDQNFQVCKSFITGVINEYVDLNELITVNDNFKDSLLRYFQSQKWGFPVYSSVNLSANKKNGFEIVIKLKKDLIGSSIKLQVAHDDKDSFVVGYGKAPTKKQAEQLASKDALIRLGVSLNY